MPSLIAKATVMVGLMYLFAPIAWATAPINYDALNSPSTRHLAVNSRWDHHYDRWRWGGSWNNRWGSSIGIGWSNGYYSPWRRHWYPGYGPYRYRDDYRYRTRRVEPKVTPDRKSTRLNSSH